MSMIKPLGDRLLVCPVPRKSKTVSGVLIPNTARWEGDNDFEFHVIAVGSKVKDINPLDRVICCIDHDGMEYITDDPKKRGFIRRSQVLAVVPLQPHVAQT